MTSFIYSAWFLDKLAAVDDQDREWVACIRIEAESQSVAKDWGDSLARNRCIRRPNDEFLRSSVEAEDQFVEVTDWSSLPRTRVGQHLSDRELGW